MRRYFPIMELPLLIVPLLLQPVSELRRAPEVLCWTYVSNPVTETKKKCLRALGKAASNQSTASVCMSSPPSVDPLLQILHAPLLYNASRATLQQFPSLELLPPLLPQSPLGLVLRLALWLLVYPHTRLWPKLRTLCAGCLKPARLLSRSVPWGGFP